jgi:thimet oligopeptidase
MLLSRYHLPVFLLLISVGVRAQDPQSQPPVWAGKPDIAAFEKAENDRLEIAQRSIDQIVAVKAPRTIENTLKPFDEAIRQLNAAIRFAFLMQNVHPDANFRDHSTEMFRKASAAQTALSLNRDVYKAIAELDLSRSDAVTRYYVQRQLLESRLAGVDKDDATRARLKLLNDQLAEQKSAFDRNIADDVKAIQVTSASELEGLPSDFIDSHKPGPDGRIRIDTNDPDFFPVMKYARNDEVRHRLYVAFLTQAYPQNRGVLESMMRTRYEIATLLGFSSWADYNAADKMILTGKNIADFIQQLDVAARPAMQREFTELLAAKRKTHPEAKEIWDYDGVLYEEDIRRSKYNFDSQSVRPYFPYNGVKQGILDTAAKLFHLSFRNVPNVPSWDSSVETWEVSDTGKIIGRFYLDMHPRAGKLNNGAMTAPIFRGIRGKQIPEAVLICNFPRPAATDPGLMEYEDVVTFFHEFGHLMHFILAGQLPWAGISGISMEFDFIEVPSQMLEEWMRSPEVLASFAKQYKTGEPIPAELVRRMNRAAAFGRASDTANQTAFTAISYDIYKSNPAGVNLDTICVDDMRHYMLSSFVPEAAHFYASFIHLGGYSSAYYTYMWDRVIAEDFFQQFDQKNLLGGDTPMRYRRVVLEPGGSMSANDLVKNFLGRPYNTVAFGHWLQEEFETSASIDQNTK